MSSTNKTTNYELSQFVGTDKPTFLGDYNGDMAKLDTALKNNSDSASQAQTKANQAYTLASQADGKAQTADGKAETAGTNATQALQKALANEASIAKFNFTNTQDVSNNITITNATLSSKKVQVAVNSDGSIGKLYGVISASNVVNQGENVLITIPTPFRPPQEINIRGGVLALLYGATGISGTFMQTLKFKPNGNIELEFVPNSSTNTYSFNLINSVLFMKNFGD